MFLDGHGLLKLVEKNDRRRFVTHKLEVFKDEGLPTLLCMCSHYHVFLYNFLLMTGFCERRQGT